MWFVLSVYNLPFAKKLYKSFPYVLSRKYNLKFVPQTKRNKNYAAAKKAKKKKKERKKKKKNTFFYGTVVVLYKNTASNSSINKTSSRRVHILINK